MHYILLPTLILTYYVLKSFEQQLKTNKSLLYLSAVTAVRSGVWIISTTIGVVALIKDDLYTVAIYILSNAMAIYIATTVFDKLFNNREKE